MEKKRLAIFINSITRAGAEKVVAFLLNELYNDYEIHLLLFNANEIEFPIPATIKIVQIGRPSSSNVGPFEILKLPWYALKVKRYLKKNNIPLILSFLNRPNFIVGIMKGMGWKGKGIISERTMTSSYFTTKTLGGRLGRFLVSYLYNKADLVITNTKLNELDLKETFHLKNKIRSIYNPVNCREAMIPGENIAEEIKKEKGQFIFCHIGRHNYYKNQELLLKALSKLGDYNCKLMMIGKDVPQKLTPLIDTYQLHNKVILCGVQQNVFPYLHAADAFVLCSIMEGFPNVVLEALACSVPVISTDCKSGPREILAPNTSYPEKLKEVELAEFGMLVQSNDADMLADAMKKIMEDNALRENYAKKSAKRAMDFDMEPIIRQFKSALDE